MTKHNLEKYSIPPTYTGREIEAVACLKELLEKNHQLITITGEAGIGKTTFAVFLAHWLIERAKFGSIYFIELAGAKDIDDLFTKLADTLNIELKIDLSKVAQDKIKEAEFEQRKNQLYQRLSSPETKTLLILDNFENLLNDDICSRLIKELITIPTLYLLVTSRPPLNIIGWEEAFQLPELRKDEAGELFKKLSKKEVTQADKSLVDKICEAIHYIPLAIELVSQHTNMGFGELYESLKKSRLSLQSADRRGVAERFNDMAISLEFSYNLLDEETKKLFIILSVFKGRFTQEAVEEITKQILNEKPQVVFKGLEKLYGWKLIKQDQNRYYLLETIREYAGLIANKKAKDFGINKDKLYIAYADYYLKVAQDSKDPWDEITYEFDNISNAADLVAERIKKGDKKNIQLAYDYAVALNNYIYRRSIKEGLGWLLAGVVACQELGKKEDGANLYNSIGLRYNSQGNYSEALNWYEKSIEILKEIGSWHSVAVLLSNIGLLYRDTSKKELANQYLKENYLLYLQLNLKSEAATVKQILDSL